MINKRTRERWKDEATAEILEMYPEVDTSSLIWSIFGGDMYVNICQHFDLSDGRGDGYGAGFVLTDRVIELDPSEQRKLRKRQNAEAAKMEARAAAA